MNYIAVVPLYADRVKLHVKNGKQLLIGGKVPRGTPIRDALFKYNRNQDAPLLFRVESGFDTLYVYGGLPIIADVGEWFDCSEIKLSATGKMVVDMVRLAAGGTLLPETLIAVNQRIADFG